MTPNRPLRPLEAGPAAGPPSASPGATPRAGFTRPLATLLAVALALAPGAAPAFARPSAPASSGSAAGPAAAPSLPGSPLPAPGAGEGGQGGSAPQEKKPPPELIELEGPLLEADTWKRLGDEMLAKTIDFIPALVKALIVLLAFYLFYRVVVGVFGGVVKRTSADPALLGITVRLLRYGILALAVIMALAQLGFNVASMLAGVGIVGLALGLAAQETVANLIAGFTILWDRPFRIGDNVTIAGTFGKVRSIGLRTTRIETVERLDCILPNKEIVQQKIVNHTMSPEYRLPIPISIAYKEDSREAREVLLEAARGHRLIHEDPEPVVVMIGLGDSSVDLELRVWLRDPYTEREALFELLELSKIALDEAGIEIPFPQRTLHFGSGTLPLRMEEPAGAGGAGDGGRGAEGEER